MNLPGIFHSVCHGLDGVCLYITALTPAPKRQPYLEMESRFQWANLAPNLSPEVLIKGDIWTQTWEACGVIMGLAAVERPGVTHPDFSLTGRGLSVPSYCCETPTCRSPVTVALTT